MDGGFLLNKINEQLTNTIIPSISSSDPLKDFPLFVNQFAYVIDHNTLEVISHKGFDTCLGYHENAITINFILNLFHPDDASKAMELSSQVLPWDVQKPAEPFNSVFCLNYRVRLANRTYINILRQTAPFETDLNGTLLKSLSVCTDITHLEISNTVSAKFMGGNAVIHLNENTLDLQESFKLSKREMEILALAAQGKTSEVISTMLNISPKTVNTHRRNMLVRTGFKNIAQLIAYMVGKKLI